MWDILKLKVDRYGQVIYAPLALHETALNTEVISHWNGNLNHCACGLIMHKGHRKGNQTYIKYMQYNQFKE